MLKAIHKFFTNTPMSIEDWSQANADLTTPDEIIAAAIAKSFASHWEDWSHLDCFTGDVKQAYKIKGRYDEEVSIRNNKAGVVVMRKIVGKRLNDYGGWGGKCYGDLFVNDIKMDRRSEDIIVFAYHKIKTQVIAAEKAAQEAKAAMERNERAWNLAEKLLGMKRNEFGALVPVQTAE